MRHTQHPASLPPAPALPASFEACTKSLLTADVRQKGPNTLSLRITTPQ